MVIVGLLSWWYTAGLIERLRRLRARLSSVADYFSLSLLARTLFAPFRQISAGQVDGPLPVQLRAFFDRLFSRVIGAVVRLIMIGVGTAALVGMVVYGLIVLAGWLLMPLAPMIGLVMMMTGWVPWRL